MYTLLNKELPEENQLLQSILADAKIGWWKADYEHQLYIISDFIKDTFRLTSNRICFDEFQYIVREDYKTRIAMEIENIQNQFIYDQTFPICCPHGEFWLRSRIVDREMNANKITSVFGYIQLVSNPEIKHQESASFERLNNLLYQLNIISHTLLSFLKSDSPDEVINKILSDILKLFKGGRSYIIEYDWENQTQTCTHEVTDSNVCKEQTRINQLPTMETPWWTQRVSSGHTIVLSSLDELPKEAENERAFLALQQIKSLIVVPLFSRNGVWGYMGIDIVEESHQWKNEDCQWFSSLANIVNICIELQKSEQEALIDKAYLQNLHKHMPLGYVRFRILYNERQEPTDYLFVDANDAAERIIECSSQEYVGQKASNLGLRPSEHMTFLSEILNSDNYQERTFHLKNIEKHCHAIIYAVQKDEIICLFSDMTETFNTHEALDRSEKILRNIYDNLPAGIELYDKNGKLADMNIKDVEIFGLRRKEDALGVNLFENPNIPAEIKEKIRNQQPVSFRLHYPFKAIENYYPSKKKNYIEIYTTASPLYDTQGNLIHYLFINLDNTEINNAYSRIAEFESSFSVVSKFGKIGYCKFDVLTRTGYGVPQWFRNLGEKETTPLAQIIGVYTYVHDEDRNYIMECIRKVKAGEINNFSRDLRIHSDSGWKWTRVNVMRNTMNTDSQKLEMICVNYDITELKETEKELIEAKNKAEVSDRLKSAFLANMSHEIRTPLNAIVGFSNLLAETEDRDEQASYINIVKENNELLLQLISDILDLSKIEAGTFEFTAGDIDVNQLCQEIVRSMSMKVKDENVKIRFEQHLADCHIHSDKNRLTQVITNFINNALKFTSEGYITLGYEWTDNQEIKFYVRDTGTGIPEDMQETIFERFVKLNSFVQGTGLGLSICKSIVEQMGGRIGVESKLGTGSCFWFTYPSFQEPVTNQADKSSERTIAPKNKAVPESRPTLLVAEDTDSNFLLLSSILKKEYLLVRARNGKEAIELFSTTQPNLILMDVKMPVIDGIDASRIIREKDPFIPIIAITAFAFDSDKQRVLAAGCNDYIAKPIQVQELKDKIKEFLNR